MIFDCVSFFNELDVLDIRLNVLDKFVDYFIIIECEKTFTNKNKPLYFYENKHLFEKFNHKIIHFVVGKHPETEIDIVDDPWKYEYYQKTFFLNYFKTLNKDKHKNDIIIISDIDEIPNLYSLNKIIDYKYPVLLKPKFFYGDLCHRVYNSFLNKYEDPIRNLFMTHDVLIHKYDEIKFIFDRINRFKYINNNYKIYENGIHLSFAKDKELTKFKEKIYEKLEAFPHQEFNNKKVKTKIIERFLNNQDILNRNELKLIKQKFIPTDEFENDLYDFLKLNYSYLII
jgi:beta-1,4-mannosyl-glycoprotein beta-1,4-N-acetylglucosaminyltransferase